MLRYFPVAADDELLYSQIARYHIHTCSPGIKQTIAEVFGSRNVAAVVDLPAHLNQLHKRTSHITRQKIEDLLQWQTLFPVFSPFLGQELSEKVRASMLSDYGGDIHTRAGLAASAIKRPTQLRVCPSCYCEQLTSKAEAYWQRLFQIAGVLVCPKHKVPLRNTGVSYVPENKHQFHSAFQLELSGSASAFSKTDLDRLSLLARDFQTLLTYRFPAVSLSQWSLKYRQLLSDCGLTKGQSVRQADLMDRFVQFWGKKILQILHCELDQKSETHWLAAMARKHRKNNHPLRHLLLFRSLAGFDEPLNELFQAPSGQMSVRASQPVATRQQNSSSLEQGKKRWLQLQKDHPQSFAKQLRLLDYALHVRLYRNDRDWLMQNTPRQDCQETINRRVNWNLRDRAFARAIIRKVRELKKQPGYPRLSKKYLAQATHCLSHIEKHLKKLPLTQKVLVRYSESVPAYQCRRIDEVVTQLSDNSETVLSWKIYRQANIRPDVSQEVKKYIRSKVDDIISTRPLPAAATRSP